MDGVSVTGEIYEMVPEMLEVLDDLEGVESGLYRRVHIHLQAPFDQRRVEGYLYEQSIEGLADCGDQWPSV